MKTIKWLFALAVPAFIVSCKKDVSSEPLQEVPEMQSQAVSRTGSGAPSGSHFNLNIIGVENPKKFDYNAYEQQNTEGRGRRIFVPLNGNAKINLQEGDYSVLDANGTDGIAAFRLPAPDTDGDGVTSYSVYVRGLGKPNGSAMMQSCIEEVADADGDGISNETYCSTTQQVNVDAHGNDNKFTNVSRQLLYVYADTDGDGIIEKIALFSDPLYTYYWDYQNSGLRLAQLRFYDIATDTNL